MAITVRRPTLGLLDRTGIPQVVSGLGHTFRHLFTKKVTVQYPEERAALPPNYRGAPALVRDPQGREKCVACSLCEYICPPKAIRIVPGEIEGSVERAPREFEINMLRCIFCGYCEEVCPEEAIFMTKVTEITGRNREDLIWKKDKLYEVGGVRPDPIRKWEHKNDPPVEREAEHRRTPFPPQ